MSSKDEVRMLEKSIGTLLNKQLQTICGSHGLKTSGVKADLQTRIKNALHENHQSDPNSFNAIRNTILNVRGGNISQANMGPSNSSVGGRNNYYPLPTPYASGSSAVHSQGYGYTNGSAVGSGSGYAGVSGALNGDTLFKSTPFYTIETRIGQLQTCPVMNSHRNSITVTLKASEYPELANCATHLPNKVMVFCGSESVGPQDIQFPHQSEIKVNGEDIKHNLRGLKNKPGSTHPVDITPFLRLKQSNYTNNVEFTYALTNKKFYLALYVCKTNSIDELVTKIKSKKIPKASVIRDISKKANDPDIVATSQKLSLRCPLSYTRIRVPCRGTACNHIQCFDASSFMQLQEQGPTWSCPICYKSAPFETLAIDEYVQEVLEKTSDQHQVTIEPDGRWLVEAEEQSEPSRSRPSMGSSRIDDDDDLSIVDSHNFSSSANGGSAGKNVLGTPSRSLLSATPNGGSGGTPNTQRSGSNKRSHEVIDLTLSSDEDDEPIVRAPKRQYTGPSNGINFPPLFSNF